MRKLALRVAKGLENSDYCAIHDPELTRIWPDKPNREIAIYKFAGRYGWRVRFYKDGSCVVFEKEPPSQRN
jgi:hypothetical protein